MRFQCHNTNSHPAGVNKSEFLSSPVRPLSRPASDRGIAALLRLSPMFRRSNLEHNLRLVGDSGCFEAAGSWEATAQAAGVVLAPRPILHSDHAPSAMFS